MSSSDDFSANVQALSGYIMERAKKQKHSVREPSARQLALIAGRVISAMFERKNVRPSKVARTLPRLARHLRKAANCANEIGPIGLEELLAMDPRSNLEDQDALVEIAQLNVWADLCERAAQSENLKAIRNNDTQGGPTADLRLQPLVRTLAMNFEKYLGAIPRHTWDPDGGEAKSFFDQFVIHALTLFAPEATTKPRAIEDAIGRGLNDLKWYKQGIPEPA